MFVKRVNVVVIIEVNRFVKFIYYLSRLIARSFRSKYLSFPLIGTRSWNRTPRKVTCRIRVEIFITKEIQSQFCFLSAQFVPLVLVPSNIIYPEIEDFYFKAYILCPFYLRISFFLFLLLFFFYYYIFLFIYSGTRNIMTILDRKILLINTFLFLKFKKFSSLIRFC